MGLTRVPRSTPNRLNSTKTCLTPGFTEIDLVKHNIRAERFDPMPSIVPSDIVSMSDDECVARLARAIEGHDLNHLDEVAQLIGRLAVTIE